MKFKESEEQPVVEVSIEAQEGKCPVKEAKDSIIKILLSFFFSNTIKYIGFIRNKSK